MHGNTMKKSLFSLLGVKTGGGGGGGREGGVGESFHGHPAKREGHGRSSITAGVRKRQRFRVVRLGGWRGCGRSEKQ